MPLFWAFLLKALMARAASGSGGGGNKGGFEMPKAPDIQGMSAGTTQDPVSIGAQARDYVANPAGGQAFGQNRSGGAGGIFEGRMRQRGLGGLFGGGS